MGTHPNYAPEGASVIGVRPHFLPWANLVFVDRIPTKFRIPNGGAFMRIRTGLLLVAALLLGAVPLFSHHSIAAQFDAQKRVTLKGDNEKIEWTNPHAYIFVSV